MATANRIKGNDFRLYIINEATKTPIPTENTTSISISNSLIECTDKSISWQQFIDGVKGWTSSVEFHYLQEATDPGFMLVEKLLAGQTSTKVIIGKIDATGDVAFEGNVRIASVEVSASANEIMSCSLSLTGDGALTIVRK